MKNFISLITYSLVFVMAFSTYAQSRELVDKVIAVVNDDVITLRELEEAEKQVNKSSEQEISRSKVLEQLIDRTLIEQQAKQIGVSVSDEEVEGTIEVLRQRYNLQGGEMEEALKKQNITEEEFRDQWKYQLLTKKVIDRKLQGRVAVTRDEIREYYEENYGEIESADEVRISHILVKDQTEAQKVAELASSGENFAELAAQYSKDQTSAPAGGDLGFFANGQLMKPLEDAIEGVKIGEITGPVETPAGYHIIKVTDRKSAEEGLPESVRVEIRETLYNQKVQKVLEQWLTEVKETAYIEKKI